MGWGTLSTSELSRHTEPGDRRPALGAPGRGSQTPSGVAPTPPSRRTPQPPVCGAWAVAVFLSRPIYSGLALLGAGWERAEARAGRQRGRRKPGGGWQAD